MGNKLAVASIAVGELYERMTQHTHPILNTPAEFLKGSDSDHLPDIKMVVDKTIEMYKYLPKI